MALNNYFTEEKIKKLKNYMQLNQYVEKGQILFTGSSLMEQFPVCEYCIGAGIKKPVYNRGIGGYTTDEFLNAIHTQLLDLEPSKVFINIGTNDIAERDDQEDWLTHLLKNYEMILLQLKEALPLTEVYVMAYYPVNEHLPDRETNPAAQHLLKVRTNANIRLANAHVKELAERLGFNYIDVSDGLFDENGELKAEYTIEGVHMYAEAYHRIFENLRQYI